MSTSLTMWVFKFYIHLLLAFNWKIREALVLTFVLSGSRTWSNSRMQSKAVLLLFSVQDMGFIGHKVSLTLLLENGKLKSDFMTLHPLKFA